MKKGYFFTMDAFIAISILVICVTLIFSIQSVKPYAMQSAFISEDMMGLIANTKLHDVNNEYYDSLVEEGKITQTDNTILEQIAWFYVSGQNAAANNFTINMTYLAVPEKYGFQLILSNETVNYNITVKEGPATQEKAKLLITSKRLVMGENDGIPWSPLVAEVRLWQ